MNIDEKERRFVYALFERAYSSAVILPLTANGGSGFEYFLACRKRMEKCVRALEADITSHDALAALKKELVTYKAAHTRQSKNYRRKKSKKHRKREQGRQLASLLPQNIFTLASIAELTQYNIFFEKHPTAARFKPKNLLNRKQIQKTIRSETMLDVYLSVYATNEVRIKIEESLLENPKELYPAARAMTRHFKIHSGMTNTGKTYNAISALKRAETGVYLGPLRLLAMEIQETLLMDNVMCSMKTGEEENIVPYATHVSSTVEMIDLYAFYETAVIDECQMIADTERGCAWTRAILGVRAEEIHLCTAPDAVDILVKIIEDCGDEYEIIEYERRTPIEYDESLHTDAKIEWVGANGRLMRPSCEERLKKINLKEIQYGDAIIAFSRSDVLEFAELLRKRGIEASVVYGALPYETRKRQLKRFMNRETQVIVATDAIGMGLNLPIRRVIFTTAYKFDGESYRLLKPSEVKQIAGRAGRKGIYDKGYVYSVVEQEHIKNSLTMPYEPIKKAYIDFDTAFIDMESGMREILRAWTIAEMPHEIYEKINVSRILSHLKHIEDICKRKHFECDKGTEYSLATVTFDDADGAVFGTWIDYVKEYLSGKMALSYPRIKRSSVEGLESSFKKVDLYYSFCRTMGYKPDMDWIENMKAYLSDEINYRLVHGEEKANETDNTRKNRN